MTIDEAESAIQSTLIDLVNSTGRDIDVVRVDTRNFANLKVEIILKPSGASMREDGLTRISVETATHAVALHYEAGAEYSIDEITAYAVDLTEGRCREIKIFEGDKLVRHLKRDSANLGPPDPRHQYGWLDIAGEPGNE